MRTKTTIRTSKMKRKPKEIKVSITKELDVARAAGSAMAFAGTIGFAKTQQYIISTAVSELARNIFLYALKGEIKMKVLQRGQQKGIQIIAQDSGPGIKDVAKAMQDHFSTSAGLGLGLPGVKRLMDEFGIDDKCRVGTKITIRKWL